MAINDIYNDVTPHNTHRKFQGPTIQELRSALTAFSSTTYTAAVLNGMTKQDMTYACRANGLTVTDTTL